MKSTGLIILFVLTVFTSCNKIKLPGKDKDIVSVEGYVRDKFSNEILHDAEVQLFGWYESWFNEGVYHRTPIDTVYTDANGHFLIKYKDSFKHGYSLNVSRESYFREECLRGSVTFVNNLTFHLFPHGYVKTNITNKIDSARWLGILFVPYLGSNEILRDGFINTDLLTRACADTSIITTTIGGVINNMKISLNTTDYIPNEKLVKDTSFLTLSHDTIYLKIILK